FFFFFSSRRRHTRCLSDWSSDVCSSDLPRGLSTWNLVDSAFKKHGLSYQVAMEVGGWEVIKKYVELDLGISLIISIGICGQEKLEVIPAGEFFPKRTYGVVLRKGRILTPQAKRFVNLLLSSRDTSSDTDWGNGEKTLFSGGR